eukprot:TRINITY_DN7682_c0_g1_i1.p1 TRINITY_DN7682_c0_g1~~TRINITY_DN7682_c0_g1_i1.p1  ORF type:complete len:589 (+),score=124.39 TRINITY_DN7682_c0_g1_i1:20-1786(+)
MGDSELPPPPHINYDYYSLDADEDTLLRALQEPHDAPQTESSEALIVNTRSRSNSIGSLGSVVSGSSLPYSSSNVSTLALMTENDHLRDENSSHMQRISQLEAQNTQIRDVLSQMRKEMEMLHHRPTDVSPSLESPSVHPTSPFSAFPETPQSGEEVIFLRKQVQTLSATLGKMRAELLESIKDCHESQNMLAASESSLAASRFRQHQMETTLLSNQKQMAVLTGQCEMYYRDLIEAKERNRDLTTQLFGLKNELAKCGTHSMLGEQAMYAATIDDMASTETGGIRRERDLEATNVLLRSKLEAAALDIKRLMEEKNKLMDISNMLRSDLNARTSFNTIPIILPQSSYSTSSSTPSLSSASISTMSSQSTSSSSVSSQFSSPGLSSPPPMTPIHLSSGRVEVDPSLLSYTYENRFMEMQSSMRKLELKNKILQRELDHLGHPPSRKSRHSSRDVSSEQLPKHNLDSFASLSPHVEKEEEDDDDMPTQHGEEVVMKDATASSHKHFAAPVSSTQASFPQRPLVAVGVAAAVVPRVKPISSGGRMLPTFKAAAERAEAKRARLLEQRATILGNINPGTHPEDSSSSSDVG